MYVSDIDVYQYVVRYVGHYVSKMQNEMWCPLREMSRQIMARMKTTQFRDEGHLRDIK